MFQQFREVQVSFQQVSLVVICDFAVFIKHLHKTK